VFLFAVLGSATAQAGKPQDSSGTFAGNGYPSGPHFNLNLNAKSDHFRCPAPQFVVVVDNNGNGDAGMIVDVCDPGDVCDPDLGNVVFLPRVQGTDPISLLIESGRKGPKTAPDATDLEVVDWCTQSFPDDGSFAPPLGDAAVVRLPKNAEGYAVYARVHGKPGRNQDERTFAAVPELALVQDEAGNDLLYLGLVSSDGVFDSEGILLRRTDDSRKGKGVRKATDIGGLFRWSGDVCYLQPDTDPFCLDDSGANLCTMLDLCCVDLDLSGDGVYEACDLLTDVGVDPDGDGNFECPLTDVAGNPYTPLTAECRHYDSKWVFNIADFVDLLLDITSDAYHVQIRFYPLPLER
jgi:hypothetical protein